MIKDFLVNSFIIIGSLATYPFSAYTQTKSEEVKKPNIIFIMADDMGWTGLSGYGSNLHETPVIDQLSKEGMKFTNAYSAAAICTPTRASILTGKCPARLNMTTWHENAGPPTPNTENKLLPPTTLPNLLLDEFTIAEMVKKAGYFTAHIGKWHLGDANHYPETQGFDINIGGTMWGMPQTYWYPFRGWRESDQEIRYVPGLDNIDGNNANAYLTDRLTDKAIEVIEAKKNDSFFLNLSYYNCHVPIEGKPELVDYFEHKLTAGNKNTYHTNPGYAAMIASLDKNIGRVFNAIKKAGIEENTIIFFYSDNGGQVNARVNLKNNYPLRSGKGSLYEGGIRVPFIVKWPGITKPGDVCDYPVSSIDILPTIQEMTGLTDKENHLKKIDGVSIVPLLRDPSSTLARETLYWHFPHYYPTTTPVSAIRKGKWKLLEFFEDNHLELYNLKSDLGENHNLAEKHPDIVADLYHNLKAWRKSIDAKYPSTNPQYIPAP
ncbi:sulfatase [uncultured Kriegella sp.]|uniref:sulfatase n=1 Tax=uncultured Kriegella sp. TaxID=1798910 RepID=UPI0030DC5A26|tara:strand:- start:343347 stop:344819 length:1473 start_codon:yes stop_codon:yes gene_type:complete